MSKVLLVHPVAESVRKRLESAAEVIMTENREEILALVPEVDAIHAQGGFRVDEELLSKGKKLGIIASASVGYNNFNMDLCRRYGLMVTNTPAVLNAPVADLAICLMIACAKRVCELDRFMRERKWVPGNDPHSLFGLEITGKTLGIIGMGRIGYDIARRAKLGMDMDILYYNRHHNPKAEADFGARLVSKETLMSESDFVVLVTPLTEETRGIVGEKELALMKPTGILVNVARGPVVDEAALAKALKEHQIYAAGLDVYDQEPTPLDNPLLDLENCVHVPHIGTASDEMREKMSLLAADNIVDYLSGKTPRTLVPELEGMVPKNAGKA